MADPVELILDFFRRYQFLKAEAAFMAELLSREEERRLLSHSESASHQNPQMQSLSSTQCTAGINGKVQNEKSMRTLHRGNLGRSKSNKVSSFPEDARFPLEKQLYVEYEPGRVIGPDNFCTTSGACECKDTSTIPKGEVPRTKNEGLVTFPIQDFDRAMETVSCMFSKNQQVEHAVVRSNEAKNENQQSDPSNNSLELQRLVQKEEYHNDEFQNDYDLSNLGRCSNIESKKSAQKKEDKAFGVALPIEGQQVEDSSNTVELHREVSMQVHNGVSTDLLDIQKGSVANVLVPCSVPKASNIDEQQMSFSIEATISMNENIGKSSGSNDGNIELALSQAISNGNSVLGLDSKILELYPISVHDESGELPRLSPQRPHSFEENMASPKRDGMPANSVIPRKTSESNTVEKNDCTCEVTLDSHPSTDTLMCLDFANSGSKPSRSSVSQGIVEALPDHVPAISNAADGWCPDDYCDSDTYEDDDDPGYHRQLIEDEEWFLAHEIDHPSDEERPKQCTEKFSLKHAIESTRVEQVGGSYGEEESYFSGEEYYGLQADKEDHHKPRFSELRGLVDENFTSFNVRQLEFEKSQLTMLGDDIIKGKMEGQGFKAKEPNSMHPQPVWMGFVGDLSTCEEYDSGFDACEANMDADDDDCESVRSGGNFVSSDIADVGSERRHRVPGGSSEGEVERLKDQSLAAYMPVNQNFDSKNSHNSEREMSSEVRNTSEPHFEGSDIEHDLVLQYYNEAWGLCKRPTNEELASRSTFESKEPSGNKRLPDCRNMGLLDNGGLMFEGFSFPSPSSTGGVAISATGSGQSPQSNRESSVQADETDEYGAAMVGPDDTLTAWRQKTNNSSPFNCSSEDILQSSDLPSHLNGSFISTGFHENLVSKTKKPGNEESKLECQHATGQLQEDALDGQEETRTSKNADDTFEVFNLRIIHWKNRTGFEEEKDFPITVNAVIAGRYHVTEYLGSAAFSKAIQAHDLHTGMDVCMKIIKNNKDFFDQSLDEIKLLKFINQQDPADKYHILRLYDSFYHQEHLFIVCELLRANLYEFHKFNRESGGEMYFTMPRLQSITHQCLEALEFLHRLGIIHCDLKPENILIKSYSRCEIKIIDLGSSCFQTDHLCSYVQSRSYRAPEVILGLPYDQKIDIWSLGCILAELCSGNVLFQNDSLATLLARVVSILGPIDPELLAKGHDAHKYFTKNHMIYERNQETDQLEYLIPKKTSLSHRLPMGDHGFVEFVGYLLECNPSKRPTATAALQHPWLSFPYDPISL